MTPTFQMSATVLDSPDAGALASFYESLLGWRRASDDPDWVMLKTPVDVIVHLDPAGHPFCLFVN